MYSAPCTHAACQCFVPPYVIDRLARSADPEVRSRALASIASAASFRTSRSVHALLGGTPVARAAAPNKERLVYDARGGARLPGRLVRSEGQRARRDEAVNEAYDHAGTTWDFYQSVFGRDSLDGHGMPIVSSVHVGEPGSGPLDNAFWNGEQMAYGDGDGVVFARFTRALEVVGHELSHGVQAYASNLAYHDESGALNEHFADVFGVLIRQWKRGEPAREADWVVGADVLVPLGPLELRQGRVRRGIRDMQAPGTAYSGDPYLGDDPQPAHYRKRYRGGLDNGGVHLNSGIPNRAFVLAAQAIGGNAWEVTGAIWYEAMHRLRRDAGFAQCAQSCVRAAAAHGAAATAAVAKAWADVGVAAEAG